MEVRRGVQKRGRCCRLERGGHESEHAPSFTTELCVRKLIPMMERPPLISLALNSTASKLALLVPSRPMRSSEVAGPVERKLNSSQTAALVSVPASREQCWAGVRMQALSLHQSLGSIKVVEACNVRPVQAPMTAPASKPQLVSVKVVLLSWLHGRQSVALLEPVVAMYFPTAHGVHTAVGPSALYQAAGQSMQLAAFWRLYFPTAHGVHSSVRPSALYQAAGQSLQTRVPLPTTA